MQVVKTVRIPVHYALTKRKLHILESLTARLTYGVWTWSRLFDERDLKGTNMDRARLYQLVKTETRLPGHMIQCCFDTTKWMWRSYRALHREWWRQIAEAKRSGDLKWLRKLSRREPQKPFSRGMPYKVPIWFDRQLGSIEKSKIRLCSYVARISTLRRGLKLTVPLNPAEYHLDLLSKSDLKGFQLVKREGKYYELTYNADYVGALNIGSRFLPTATTRRATVGLARAGDEHGTEAGDPRSRKRAQLTQTRQPIWIFGRPH